MADNTTINAATTSGDVLATDDIAGVKYPRSKIVIGADGTNDGDVSATNPLPISGTGAAGTANSGVVTIQGIASMTPVQIGDNSGSITVDDGGSSLTVDGSVAITGTVAVTDNSGSITVDAPVGTPVFVRLSDGASAITALPITDNSGSITVDNAGTFAVQAAQSGTWNITTCSVVSSLTGSGVQHDNADSGNPHKIGAKAIASLSGATMVAAADRTNLYAGIDGVLIIRPHCNLEDIVSGVAAITDGSSTSVIAAQGAEVKTYVTSVTIANTSATDVTVDLRDGTAGSVKWTFPVPNLGGVTHTFNPPLAFSANTIVAADPSAAASTVTVSISGFKSKV